MPWNCEGTLCGLVKCRASSTTATLMAVREMKPFEVGRERAMMFRESLQQMTQCGTSFSMPEEGRKLMMEPLFHTIAYHMIAGESLNVQGFLRHYQ
ncbi:hypothetical protein AVEN_268155-1 [Araneus ventricosus]|uniref:Uncharacterized protein n=1 Tax=Araneus ventricosus TaxID=182803 RepID=A0A4Y2LVB8_ARAVE|nr:hypothetical protein AVEN_268155-1 [Araneus ventricosus]